MKLLVHLINLELYSKLINKIFFKYLYKIMHAPIAVKNKISKNLSQSFYLSIFDAYHIKIRCIQFLKLLLLLNTRAKHILHYKKISCRIEFIVRCMQFINPSIGINRLQNKLLEVTLNSVRD